MDDKNIETEMIEPHDISEITTDTPFVTAKPTPDWVLQNNTKQNYTIQFLLRSALKALGFGFLYTLPVLLIIFIQAIMHIGNPMTDTEREQAEIFGYVYYVIFIFASSYLYSRFTKFSFMKSFASLGISVILGYVVSTVLTEVLIDTSDPMSGSQDIVESIAVLVFVGVSVVGTAIFSYIGNDN